MLAGSNERGTYNASNPEDQAISYMCLGKIITPHFAIRPLQLFF